MKDAHGQMKKIYNFLKRWIFTGERNRRGYPSSLGPEALIK